MAISGGVGIILGVRTVGDNENLHILIQAACRPKAISLIAFDLLKASRIATPRRFSSTWTRGSPLTHHSVCMLTLGFLVLVDNLQTIVVNVLFVYERYGFYVRTGSC